MPMEDAEEIFRNGWIFIRGLYPAILQFIDLTARLDPHGIGDSDENHERFLGTL